MHVGCTYNQQAPEESQKSEPGLHEAQMAFKNLKLLRILKTEMGN
jgi:hypothetical protein